MRVNHQHKDGQQPTKGWSPTNLRMVTQIRNCITDMQFDTYTLLAKLTPDDNSHYLPSLGGSPFNPKMVTHQPKDGACFYLSVVIFSHRTAPQIKNFFVKVVCSTRYPGGKSHSLHRQIF